MTPNQEYTHSPSDSVVNKSCWVFLQVLKPIKWQDLLEGGKNGRNAFQTGAKIRFSEKKKIWGVRGTSKEAYLPSKLRYTGE